MRSRVLIRRLPVLVFTLGLLALAAGVPVSALLLVRGNNARHVATNSGGHSFVRTATTDNRVPADEITTIDGGNREKTTVLDDVIVTVRDRSGNTIYRSRDK